MILETSSKEIHDLEKVEFDDFVNHLIIAEGYKLRIPPTKIKTNPDNTGPEGGIDGRVEDDEKTADDRWITPGLSIWQFKTDRSGNNATASRLAAEASKPRVLEALARGGHYHVAIATICNDLMRADREAAIHGAVKANGFDPSVVRLLAAAELARWASEHPSILLLSYFHRPVGMCVRLEQWEQFAFNQGEFATDGARDTIITRIRSFAVEKGSPVHLRVLGRPGVGKTRVVLEALKLHGARERVVYAQDPGGVPPEFWAWLRDSAATSVILVVDESLEEEAIKLKDQALVCDGRVRLITIGVGEQFLGEKSPDYFFLDRLENESIEKLLQIRFTSLSREQSQWIARLTEGYVKLAVACGEAIAKDPSIDVKTLTQIGSVSYVLDKLLPEPRKKLIMQALSILTRVGFEEDVVGEAQTLARFIGVPWPEFSITVEDMHRQGLVGKKGRYGYVTPDLLASWLAAQLWTARAQELRELLKAIPTSEAKESFIERLKDQGTNETAQSVIRELLSEANFPTIEQLDSQEGSGLIYTLAFADPKSALATLERILNNASLDRLRSFKAGRRAVVNALEYIKWFEATFFGAARLLLALAEAENEEYVNNATGTWAGLFRIRLGGTEVPALDRLTLIEETLATGSPAKRILAIRAIGVALAAHEIRSSWNEKEGTRPVPP